MYAIALPGRTDRIKPLLDAAQATNLSVTVLSAVRDNDIERDAWPKTWNETNHEIGELGAVVSHVRTWHRYVIQHTTENGKYL